MGKNVHGYTTTDGDCHVMPTYGREHETSPKCWCTPDVDEETAKKFKIGEATALVWIHREDN